MKSKIIIEHILTVPTGLEGPGDPPARCEPLLYTTISCHIKTNKDKNIFTDSEVPSNPSYDSRTEAVVTDINQVKKDGHWIYTHCYGWGWEV